MSGAPHDAASTGGMPKPSYLEGYTKAAAPLRTRTHVQPATEA
jgi:hypothetical protein